MLKVILESERRVYEIYFDQSDTVGDLKYMWKKLVRQNKRSRVYNLKFFFRGVELVDDSMTCSMLKFGMDDNLVRVESLEWELEGKLLSSCPKNTWDGMVVRGWVVTRRSRQARRIVGVVNFEYEPGHDYSDNPLVTVIIHWQENSSKHGILTKPLIRVTRASNLAVSYFMGY